MESFIKYLEEKIEGCEMTKAPYRDKIIYQLVLDEYKEQLTLTDVSSMFSAKQMEQAFNDGVEAEQQRCGEFNIENYC